MLKPARILLFSLICLSAACRQNQPPKIPAVLFEPAIVSKEHVAEAIAFESELGRNYNRRAPDGQPGFRILPGDARVLIVAGHATSHMREGAPKEVDGGTGSLAYMLHRLAGCPMIYTTHQSPSDPNFYDDNEFKRALKQMIEQHRPALVIDIHGSNSSRPYDVDFGTIGGTSLLGKTHLLAHLANCLHREGLRNFSQDYFPAARTGTVTRFVSVMGVPCVQLECNISWTLSSDELSPMQRQRFAQLLQGLVRFVQSFDDSPRSRTRNTPATTRATTLRVMSFNILQGGISNARPLSRTADVIRDSGADIVGVQESQGNGAALARLLGWNFRDFPSQRGNDFGDKDCSMLTRLPITQTFRHGLRIRLPERRDVYVFNVHLPAAPYQPYNIRDGVLKTEDEVIRTAQGARGQQMQRVLDEIRPLIAAGEIVFLTGDFNEPSHLDWTSDAAASSTHAMKVAWPVSSSLQRARLIDSFRAVHSDPLKVRGDTWTPRPQPGEIHDRIDFVYFAGPVAARDSTVIGEGPAHPSDHRAVVSTFMIEP